MPGSSNVRVEIFTISFRKVLDRTFFDIPSSTPVKLELADQRGTAPASGVYYVVVTVDGRRSIAKLLILR